MRKIIYFITIVAVVTLLSGCVETIVYTGLDAYISSTAEERKARRQAQYIAEEISRTEKKDVVYTKKDFKAPNKVIAIDEKSEVWMYAPKEGKIKLFAFVGDKLGNSGSMDNTEISDDQLRDKFVDLFPCYEHLRVDAITGATIPVKTSKPSPALGSIPTTGFMP